MKDRVGRVIGSDGNISIYDVHSRGHHPTYYCTAGSGGINDHISGHSIDDWWRCVYHSDYETAT